MPDFNCIVHFILLYDKRVTLMYMYILCVLVSVCQGSRHACDAYEKCNNASKFAQACLLHH